MVWLTLAVAFFFLLLGCMRGGVGLGVMGGLGTAVLVFVFKMKPSTPPIDVMLMILAVICAAGAMEAAGGLDYLVRVAERWLRSNPKRITFYAPIVTYLFTFFAGTGHVAYSVLPVIAEVARETKVRPERPLSVAVIASQFAITGGPISAAMMAMLSMTEDKGMTLLKLMAITAPATFLACMVAAFVMNFYGKELEDDPEYQRRLAAGEIPPVVPHKDEEYKPDPNALKSVWLFLAAAVIVVVLGAVPALRPSWVVDGKPTPLDMPSALQLVMLTAAAAILFLCKPDLKKIVRGQVMNAGVTAIIAIFGIAWMGDTWFANNREAVQASVSSMVQVAPWLFAFALFALSALVNSQAATTRALMPIGLALGIPVPYLAAMFPAVNGYWLTPDYGPIIAAVQFDRTGTTRIGKWIFNHSFMLPGTIATILSVIFGFVMQAIVW
ncbi:MAG TPA: anaerobic C4-dicarboxylate transporter [Symbiobacteriaceae bacterium]